MAKTFANLARMTTATTGTGTITLASAVGGFCSFDAAGVPNGAVVSYGVADANGNYENGVGTYSSSSATLTRGCISSNNSDYPISLSGNAQVYVTMLAQDMIQPVPNKAYTYIQIVIEDWDHAFQAEVAELYVLDASGTSHTPSSVTPNTSPSDASVLYDGSTSTYYTAGGAHSGPATIQFHYSSAFIPAQITATMPAEEWSATYITVSGSNDGSTWDVIGTVTFPTWTADGQTQTAVVQYAPCAGGNTLRGLADVSITSTPATGSLLEFNGTSWTPTTSSSVLPALPTDTTSGDVYTLEYTVGTGLSWALIYSGGLGGG